MHARIAILALAAVFLLMTGCVYHEHHDRSWDHYRGADRHYSAGHHKPAQHRQQVQKQPYHRQRGSERENRTRQYR